MDSNQEFFVERTDLNWSDAGKLVLLSRPASEGSLLFRWLLILDRVDQFIRYPTTPTRYRRRTA